MEKIVVAKKRSKREKQARKGEISTLDAYKECLQFGVVELRDLVWSVVENKPIPKFFNVRNRAFIRRVLFVHFYNVPEPVKFMEELGLGKVHTIRVSRAVNEVASFPRRLMSLSLEDLPKGEGGADEASSGEKEEKKNGKSVDAVARFIMTDEVLRTWGFPTTAPPVAPVYPSAPVEGSGEPLDCSTQEGPSAKRPRIEDSEASTSGTQTLTTDASVSNADAPEAGGTTTGTDGEEAVPCVGVSVGGEHVMAALRAQALLAGQHGALLPVTVTMGAERMGGFLSTLPPLSHAHGAILEGCSSCPAVPLSGPAPAPVSSSMMAVDCEMCDTQAGLELTRLTLVDQHGRVMLDTLVKPSSPITDYRSQWSGITPALLAPVTVTTAQARLAFLKLVTADTVLVGHSLDSDLKALRVLHRKCMDTAVLYPHPRGYPLRRKLKTLAETFLKVKIQRGGAGHDSAEDARTAMQLAQMKVERGPAFGLYVDRDEEGREPLLAHLDPAAWSSCLFVAPGEGERARMKGCEALVAGPKVRSMLVAAPADAVNAARDFLFAHPKEVSGESPDVKPADEVGPREKSGDRHGDGEGDGKGDGKSGEVVGGDRLGRSAGGREAGHGMRSQEGAVEVELVRLCSLGLACGSAGEAKELLGRLVGPSPQCPDAQSVDTKRSGDGAGVDADLSGAGCSDGGGSGGDGVSGVGTNDKGDGGSGLLRGGTLVIVSAQTPDQVVDGLRRRKKACANVKAASTWTKELEEQLTDLASKHNYCPAHLTIM